MGFKDGVGIVIIFDILSEKDKKPSNKLIERLIVITTIIRRYGGPGSGHHGHAGRPGMVGGSGAGGGGDIQGLTKEDYKTVTNEEKFAQASYEITKAGIDSELSKISSRAPVFITITGDVNKETIEAITENAYAEVSRYGNYLSGDTMDLLHSYVRINHKIMQEASGELKGVKASDLDALTRDSVRKLVYQEIMSNRCAFTDHGIRHVVGNVLLQQKIMDSLGGVSGKEKLLACFAMVNHDVGYTTPMVAKGGLYGLMASKDHKAFSEKIANEQAGLWNKDKIFSKQEYERAASIIRTHDSSSLDVGDKVTFATRVADNLALFHENKLPSMFAYIPKGNDYLVKMGLAAKENDKVAFAFHQKGLYKTIDNSNLNRNLKRDLKTATRDINYLTPKFTLGTLAGKITHIGKAADAVIEVKIKYNKYDTFLQKHFDMGQNQTKKLLVDYGITDFSKSSYNLGNLDGNPILKLTVEGYTGTAHFENTTIIRRYGGPGSGYKGHKGHQGMVGGSSAFMSVAKGDVAKMAKERGVYVPPAWTDVRFNADPKAPLQVKGKDAKGRTQYIYSAEHGVKAAAEKFARLKDFHKDYNKLKNRIDKDFDKSQEAKVLTLIAGTGIRVGSAADTKAAKKAYGASTLEKQHVKISGSQIMLEFTGKKGVEIKTSLQNKKLADYISKRKDGPLFDTNDDKVRDYLKNIDGNFKPKDFRTYKGTSEALKEIKQIKGTMTKQKAIAYVSKHVAKILGNTPGIAKKDYIAPEVWDTL